MRTTVVVVATLSLLLGGCGASDEEQAATNIEEAVLADDGFLFAGADIELTESEASCVSEGIVEAVGVAGLQEAGLLQDDLAVAGDLSDADLGAADSDAVGQVLRDCLGDKMAKANIKASILEDNTIAGTTVTEEDATCLSDGFVDRVGTEQLQEHGLLDDQLDVRSDMGEVTMDAGDADAMADVFVECVDAEKMLEEQVSAMTGSLSGAQLDCMTEVLDEDKVKEIMSAAFQGDTADMQSSLQEDFMQCVRP